MRSFIRHAANMPVRFKFQTGKDTQLENMQDVSKGGLSFFSDSEIPIGAGLCIEIPNLKYPFKEECIVVWCRPSAKKYRVGVRFNDDKTAFRMRMIEQICYIEKYREEMKSKGRALNWLEASKEWIDKFAEDFPRIEA